MTKNRLDEDSYIGANAYSITPCCCDGQKLIVADDVACMIRTCLTRSAEATGFEVIAYCLMPEHAHLLVSTVKNVADLRAFVRLFKQMSEFWFQLRRHKRLWQRSFYDHILRKEESLAGVTDYILHNPVRRGLVQDETNYAYSWVSDRDYCDC